MSETGQSVNTTDTTDQKPTRSWFVEERLARSLVENMLTYTGIELDILSEMENPDIEKISELKARMETYRKERSEVLDGWSETIEHVIAKYEPVCENYMAQIGTLMDSRPRTPRPRTPSRSEVLQSRFGKSRTADLTKEEWYEFNFGRKPGEEPDESETLERLAKVLGVQSEWGKAELAKSMKPSIASCREWIRANPADFEHSIFCKTGLLRELRR